MVMRMGCMAACYQERWWRECCLVVAGAASIPWCADLLLRARVLWAAQGCVFSRAGGLICGVGLNDDSQHAPNSAQLCWPCHVMPVAGCNAMIDSFAGGLCSFMLMVCMHGCDNTTIAGVAKQS